jgi:hypothetical protein
MVRASHWFPPMSCVQGSVVATLGTNVTQIWVLRLRLEKQPTDLRQYACYFGDRAPSASEERTRCDASRTSNDADEPFQADPEGRWRFSDFLRCSLLT